MKEKLYLWNNIIIILCIVFSSVGAYRIGSSNLKLDTAGMVAGFLLVLGLFFLIYFFRVSTKSIQDALLLRISAIIMLVAYLSFTVLSLWFSINGPGYGRELGFAIILYVYIIAIFLPLVLISYVCMIINSVKKLVKKQENVVVTK